MTTLILRIFTTFLVTGFTESAILQLDLGSIRRELGMAESEARPPDSALSVETYTPPSTELYTILCSENSFPSDIYCNVGILFDKFPTVLSSPTSIDVVRLNYEHSSESHGYCSAVLERDERGTAMRFEYKGYGCSPPVSGDTLRPSHISSVSVITIETRENGLRLVRVGKFEDPRFQPIKFSMHPRNITDCVNDGERCLYLRDNSTFSEIQGPVSLMSHGRTIIRERMGHDGRRFRVKANCRNC